MVLKMNNNDINDFIPSLLNPRCVRKPADLSFTQNSFMSKCSLSLKRKNSFSLNASTHNKENCQNIRNINSVKLNTRNSKQAKVISTIGNDSLDFTAIKDLNSVTDHSDLSESVFHHTDFVRDPILNNYASKSSNTELDQIIDAESDSTVIYDINNEPTISVSFGINFCDSVDVSANNCTFNRMIVSNNGNNTTVDCEIIETSNVSTDSELEEMIEEAPCPQKRCAVAVNLEIKKNKLSTDTEENSKVLILNTSAIKKISHVIVQPPNYKTVKRKLSGKNKFRNIINLGSITNDGASRAKLRQKTLDSFYFKCSSVKTIKVSEERSVVDNGNEHLIRDEVEMSKNLGVADAVRSERVRKSPQKGSRNEGTTVSGRGTRKDSVSPRQEIKTSCSSPRARTDSASVHSPRRNVESIHFSLPPKPVSSKRTASARTIPQHKIVAGTHFAVDAFSYGDIPNVKHYFLTHFHSDHYCGLKKGFNKLLYCSKITANLCTSRLGVNSKCIHVVNVDEMIKIDDVEVIALEANHCPGAIMLVFTLPNGKTLLHTGDFRASPVMESYPVFWNRDIHTIYLDTTYCNPRYDFPTQEQSLEMAVLILRQKKLALEKLGKSFSSVLIVCGTYTIGKEKFFMGLSRRLGCAVWACPEKDLVLQAVEGKPFSHAAPQSCQLHVVPMRDLTHEKLRSYLDSLKGSFAEVVAFKPSGWENGKSASVEKDAVTVHGIPYSEHSSFSELIRFVKFLQPKQVVPTVDISGGVRAVQKYFPCPLVYKDDIRCQSKLTDFFSIQAQQQVPAVT